MTDEQKALLERIAARTGWTWDDMELHSLVPWRCPSRIHDEFVAAFKAAEAADWRTA